MLMYGFAALFISSFSYLVLNAQIVFFRIPALYSTYWFFVVYILLAVSIAILIAWLIYNAAQKVNQAASYQLINYSMVIIAPALLYVLLIKPFSQHLILIGLKKVEVYANPSQSSTQTLYNPNEFKVGSTKPTQTIIPAIPAALFDSLSLSLQNGNTLHLQLSNQITFSHSLKNNHLEQMYVGSLQNYFAVLAVSNAVYGLATLVVIDETGNLAFLKAYQNGENRLAVGSNRKTIVINRQKPDLEQLEFVEAIELP